VVEYQAIMKIISHNKPFLDRKEIEAVTKVLQSRWLISGPEVAKLENNLKNLIKAEYALAVNNGTSALHLSLITLGVKPKDEVILPTYTCSALLNAVYYIGAVPILVDIEGEGFNMDPAQVRKKLNKNTKAIIVPHTFGLPAKIDEIKNVSKVKVIEDCAIALGSSYRGKPLGAYGDISIFSFYVTKMIATGQGGAITTNNRKYYEEVKDLLANDQSREYKVRYNYHLTDIAAAIGNIQLNKLESFVEKRKHIADSYVGVLKRKKNIQYFPNEKSNNFNHYRFIMKFSSKKQRDELWIGLRKMGITSIIPITSFQLLHRYLKLDRKDFPNAEEATKTTLSLPMYPALIKEEVNRITAALDSLL